jgi:oligopeptide transport system ATP-binding protein
MGPSVNDILIQADGLVRRFPLKGNIEALLTGGQLHVPAVDGVSFDIRKNEIFGLAGQSGCGKSTLAKILAFLEIPDEGQIRFKGKDLSDLLTSKSALKAFRKRVQMILQDPYESLDPRYTVDKAVLENLRVHGVRSQQELQERLKRMLDVVGLSSGDISNKFPHELSGGQRQRVTIARAMILKPEFVIADEPVSMLDVSIRAGILKLFESLRQEFGVTFLFISHDLAVLRYLCDRIAIMYLGKIVEIGNRDAIIDSPQHPYTQALISAVPVPDPTHKREFIPLQGDIPDMLNIPSGCKFHPRCVSAIDICRYVEPELRSINGRLVACFK